MCAIDNSMKEVIILEVPAVGGGRFEVPAVGGGRFSVGNLKKKKDSYGRDRSAGFHRVG